MICTPLRCGTEFMSKAGPRGSLTDGEEGTVCDDVRQRRGRAPLQHEGVKGEVEGGGSDVVDALVEKLRASKSAGSRESCIRQLKEESQTGDM